MVTFIPISGQIINFQFHYKVNIFGYNDTVQRFNVQMLNYSNNTELNKLHNFHYFKTIVFRCYPRQGELTVVHNKVWTYTLLNTLYLRPNTVNNVSLLSACKLYIVINIFYWARVKFNDQFVLN